MQKEWGRRVKGVEITESIMKWVPSQGCLNKTGDNAIPLFIVSTNGSKCCHLRFHTDPSGTFIKYEAKAIGSGSEAAQSELQDKWHKVRVDLAWIHRHASDVLCSK